MKNRQLIFVPEINPNTFLFFYFQGQTGKSYSLREYPLHGKMIVHYAKEYPYTSDKIIKMAKFKFDAPRYRTDDEKTWQKVIAELNNKYLKKGDNSDLPRQKIGIKYDKPNVPSIEVDFDIRGKQGKEILTLDDWYKCLPKITQAKWVDGRSAKELAKAWISSGIHKMPEEIKRLLKSHSYTSAFRPEYVIVEKVTRLDKYPGGHRNHDILAVGSSGNRKVVISIEAKADEPFDREINQKGSTNPRTNIYDRIDILTRSVFGQTIKENEELGYLRYQLLTGVAGTLIEAKKHKADFAVFVVHEFLSGGLNRLKLDINKNDLNRFVGKLLNKEDFQLPSDQLIETKSIFGGKHVPGNIPLLIGKVSTNILTEQSNSAERYLPYQVILQKVYKLWEEREERNFNSDFLDLDEEPEDDDSDGFGEQYNLDIHRDEIDITERKSDWLIGLSVEFMKSVRRVDKKLKGRVLEAIQLISKNPVDQKGDTIKPLSDQHKGLWRYRIGDHRLVYQPDNDKQQVTLLSFAPRSKVYQR